MCCIIEPAVIYRRCYFSSRICSCSCKCDCDCDCIYIGLIPCLWAYDGWADVVFLAEEMHNFEARLPRVIVAGIGVVMACYLAANIA